MGKIVFILGGARSGKSRYSLQLAKESGKKTAFIATCEALDAEMKRRIVLHKKSRPRGWKTFEAPRKVSVVLSKIDSVFETVIIDCLTLLVSNLFLGGLAEREIEGEINRILLALKKRKGCAIIVSNEVGLGIVPQNKLGRDFRDIAGRINQKVAGASSEVIFTVSGIPWRIK